jgi:hypothetical protein
VTGRARGGAEELVGRLTTRRAQRTVEVVRAEWYAAAEPGYDRLSSLRSRVTAEG